MNISYQLMSYTVKVKMNGVRKIPLCKKKVMVVWSCFEITPADSKKDIQYKCIFCLYK